jgi:8-oxo-dGTP diphosphatase / 2-hydroxy-dATP diphosphatase
MGLLLKNNMNKKIYTLCFLQQPSRILLGMKKKGWGTGRWNGFGGNVEEGETIEAAAQRELLEECGVTATELKKVGVIEFRFTNKEHVTEVHVFSTNEFIGEPIESDEMRPQWFDIKDVPFDEMWEADRHWIPAVLAGNQFTAEYLYDENDKILKKELTILR